MKVLLSDINVSVCLRSSCVHSFIAKQAKLLSCVAAPILGHRKRLQGDKKKKDRPFVYTIGIGID